MLHVYRIEAIEKLPSLRRVMPMTGKGRYPLLLFGSSSVAFGNVPLRLFQVTQTHRAIHARSIAYLAGGALRFCSGWSEAEVPAPTFLGE